MRTLPQEGCIITKELMFNNKSALPSFFILLALIALLSGCSIQLVGNYDEHIDKGVTQLQKDFETFLITVDSQTKTPKCKYQNHTQFYQGSKVAISSIEVRANAIDKNEKTVKQIGLLKDSLASLENLHRWGCFTHSQVQSLRSSFNSHITAILKLELAKKRGG